MTPLGPLSALVERVRSWPVESQQGARRNAMVASTALTARRLERQDVEAYLADHPRRAAGPADAARRRARSGSGRR